MTTEIREELLLSHLYGIVDDMTGDYLSNRLTDYEVEKDIFIEKGLKPLADLIQSRERAAVREFAEKLKQYPVGYIQAMQSGAALKRAHLIDAERERFNKEIDDLLAHLKERK